MTINRRPSRTRSTVLCFHWQIVAITWRLPTIEDYKLADVNGIRKVLPNMDYAFWSASSVSSSVYSAWVFYGVDGNIYDSDRSYGYSVRCVGR